MKGRSIITLNYALITFDTIGTTCQSLQSGCSLVNGTFNRGTVKQGRHRPAIDGVLIAANTTTGFPKSTSLVHG